MINLFLPKDMPCFNYQWSGVSFATWGEIPWEFKIMVFTFVVLTISLIVTFLTKPVPTEKTDEGDDKTG